MNSEYYSTLICPQIIESDGIFCCLWHSWRHDIILQQECSIQLVKTRGKISVWGERAQQKTYFCRRISLLTLWADSHPEPLTVLYFWTDWCLEIIIADSSVVNAVVTSAWARPEVVSLSISDHLDAVPGAGGDGAPVQGPRAVGPGLQVPVLGGANQENGFPRPRPVLGNAVAKETVCVISSNFYDGNSCLQIERVWCFESDHEDQECREDAWGHDEAGDPWCQGPLVTIISGHVSCPPLMMSRHMSLSGWSLEHWAPLWRCLTRTGPGTVQYRAWHSTQYTVHPVAALRLLSTEVSDAATRARCSQWNSQDPTRRCEVWSLTWTYFNWFYHPSIKICYCLIKLNRIVHFTFLFSSQHHTLQ